MKKVLLSFLLLISILINYELIFAMDYIISDDEELEVSKEIVEDLLSQRSNLWNKLFSEETDLEQVNEKLKSIVCEPLLSYDENAFYQIKENHTNMDLIRDIEVQRIKIVESKEEKKVVDAQIKWIMQGLEGEYEEKLNYRIFLLKIDEKWKISDYSLK